MIALVRQLLPTMVRAVGISVTAFCIVVPRAHAQDGGGGGADLSLEDLLNMTVSSASKYAQKSSEAPASITIITAEEIERYGFTTWPRRCGPRSSGASTRAMGRQIEPVEALSVLGLSTHVSEYVVREARPPDRGSSTISSRRKTV